VNNQISSLRTLLNQLSTQSLPVQAKVAIRDAARQLDELADSLLTKQEESRLAALYRVSNVMGTSLDLDDVLTQVMDAVIGLTGAERGFLMLKAQDTGDWQLRAARNFSQESLESKDMEVSQTVLNTVMAGGQGVVTTDAQTDPRFSGQKSVVFYSLHSIMCSPLMVRGFMIGAIYVDNRIKKALFKQQDLDLLNAFASQAAIAIENARLYTRTDQALASRVTELETLTQIDRELNAHLDLERVIEITRKWAIRGTGSKGVWLLLTNEANRLEQISTEDQELSLDVPFVSEALQKRAPCTSHPAEHEGTQIAIPLIHSDQPLGVIVVERDQAFDEPSIQFLDRLAARAATAIENNYLYLAVQQADQAKSKFVSVVSHELRIPMTSIRGYTDLLRKEVVGPINDQQANFLEVILNNVERMSILVSDLADISRIETGRLKLERVSVSIGASIDEVVRSLQPKFEEKKQTLLIDLDMNLPLIQTDPTRLNQVLTNLLSNAWKYTPEGGEIRIAARRDAGQVRIEVKDTGIGIGQSDQNLIFSQFFRSESDSVREQQGWGLGLNVTKRLVELMEGTIGFRSVLDQGSTFWFTLPCEYEANSS
jgi:signal transduction histidine kinase